MSSRTGVPGSRTGGQGLNSRQEHPISDRTGPSLFGETTERARDKPPLWRCLFHGLSAQLLFVRGLSVNVQFRIVSLYQTICPHPRAIGERPVSYRPELRNGAKAALWNGDESRKEKSAQHREQ